MTVFRSMSHPHSRAPRLMPDTDGAVPEVDPPLSPGAEFVPLTIPGEALKPWQVVQPNLTFAVALLAGLVAFTVPQGADAQASMENASNAASDSADASARLVASGGQVVLGAIAVPLAVAGGVAEGTGAVAGDISKDLWDAANAPLVVDDAVAIAQPIPDLRSGAGEAQ
jgi:hypothetical protein